MKTPSYEKAQRERAKTERLFLFTIDVNGRPGGVGGQGTYSGLITKKQATALHEYAAKLFREKHEKETAKVQARLDWLLQQFVTFPHNGGMSAWNQDFVDAFMERFPETEKSTIIYFIGPNSSPALNRAAGMLHREGFLRAGVIGCDTVGGQFRTWARYWKLTQKGWLECKARWPEDVNRVVRTNCTTFAKILASAPER